MTETYTLAEAQAELNRRECMDGHAWDIIEVRSIAEGVTELPVRCSRCGWSGVAEMNGPDPSRLRRD